MISTLTHPGPAPTQRWAGARCTATPIDVALPVADTLAHSVALALADFDGGWLWLEDAPMATLDFVIPGTDPTGQHAAWYAGPHQMGAGRIHHLGLHFGRKDGAPFLHGHGKFAAPGWSGPTYGHVLPLQSRLSNPTRVRGFGLTGARLRAETDPETRFPLFQPLQTGAPGPAALVTLRPNQDITHGLENAARALGIGNAQIHGLGSLVHPRLQGQPPIDSYATEILLTHGTLTSGRAVLDAEIVALDATEHAGNLVPGENGLCITAEILLIPA